MLARRIIAISSEKAFARQLDVALKASGGVVDTHHTLAELGTGEVRAALFVLHLDGPLAGGGMTLLPRLPGDARVILILPLSNLAAVVDLMLASERVAGVMVAERFDGRQLVAMATRVVAGDIFGAEKMIPWGTQLHSFVVGDYHDKSRCISQISEFAEGMGVRRKHRQSISQCVDEMLMNALYDAPIDEHGRQIFSEIPIKTRLSLRVEQQAVIQYGCDGAQFVIAVRDAFGSLERATVLRYLHKCLHNEQQIDRKAGGAGLGLYLMASSATSVTFNVLPGVATEVVCTFDLETPKLQLERFGFFTERIDAAGRLASGPSRRLPAGVASHPVERRAPRAPQPARGVIAVLVAAIVVTVGLVGIAAWPRLFGPRRTQLTVHTVPRGASIEIEGKTAGTATDGTLIISDLEVGHAYPVAVHLDGHEARNVLIEPHAGSNDVTFELQAMVPTITLDSSPPGSTILIDDEPAGTTPVTITSLRPGKLVVVKFSKPGYQDATTRLEVPGPGTTTRLIQPLAASTTDRPHP